MPIDAHTLVLVHTYQIGVGLVFFYHLAMVIHALKNNIIYGTMNQRQH